MMKNTALVFVTSIILCGFWSCRDHSEETMSLLGSDGFPTLSSKKVSLRLSYDVETVSSADFGGEQPSNMNYLSMTLPEVDKKSLFYEVYEDNSIAYAIKILAPKEEGDWSTTEMVRLIKVMDGQMTVYDAQGEILFAEAKNSYHIDPAEIEQSGMTFVDFKNVAR